MITTVKTKSGTIVKYIIQQYQVGLYLAIYKDTEEIPEQITFNLFNEKKFHINLRKFLKKENSEIIKNESTILEIKCKK